MSPAPKLTVYTLEFCPNCEVLKEYLKGHGVAFTEEDMSTAASLTELRLNGVFVNEAPVLQRGVAFLTSADLFTSGAVNEKNVGPFIKGDQM